jgi:hypothetical protein
LCLTFLDALAKNCATAVCVLEIASCEADSPLTVTALLFARAFTSNSTTSKRPLKKRKKKVTVKGALEFKNCAIPPRLNVPEKK